MEATADKFETNERKTMVIWGQQLKEYNRFKGKPNNCEIQTSEFESVHWE